jgi:cation diffusion facilitator CzcD-associated flavoprotein CzcO
MKHTDLAHEPLSELDRLVAQGARERAILDFPLRPWVAPHHAQDGRAVLNVLVVGAGQAGIAILAALKREQVTGILAIDAAPADAEGPWLDVARMTVLRTPKELPGAEAGIPSLSFRSWYEARYGHQAWHALDQIPRVEWRRYLSWLRRACELPIRNGVRLDRISICGSYLAAELTGPAGPEVVLARKVVLATGVDGGGGWYVPAGVTALPKHLWAHTSEPIDFAALQHKRVAVIGAGASAMDNAAMALEAGAALVDQFCRRATVQSIQPLQWMGFAGFMQHFGDLDDAWRWRFMAYVMGLREPFTKDAWTRVSAHASYRFRLGEPTDQLSTDDVTVQIRTKAGQEEFDFIICGTGVRVEHHLRPELACFASQIATWADRYQPPAEASDERLARFPYLQPNFAFTEREPGSCPQLANIHCFNYAATLSLGPSGAAIRPLKYAVPRLVRGLTRDLFQADLEYYWQDLKSFRGTEFAEFPFHLNQG